MSAKGQITLRRDLLQHLGVRPGDRIVLDKLPDGRLEVRAARPAGKISRLFGLFKREGMPVLSVEEINRVASAGWAGSAPDVDKG